MHVSIIFQKEEQKRQADTGGNGIRVMPVEVTLAFFAKTSYYTSISSDFQN